MPKKRVLSTVLLILAVGMVLFFTLQDAEGTTSLSESVRQWLGDHGVKQSHMRFEAISTFSNISLSVWLCLHLEPVEAGRYQSASSCVEQLPCLMKA